MSEGSGAITRFGGTWFKTVVVATAIGGAALGASWGMWSAEVVANAVGVVTRVAPNLGGWINEGANAVETGPGTGDDAGGPNGAPAGDPPGEN